MSKFLRSQSGFGFIDVMVTVGVLSLVALAIATFAAQMGKVLNQSASTSQLGIVRDNLIVLVRSNASWARTIRRNSHMSCLHSGAQCTAAANNAAAFAIYDASNSTQPYYDGANQDAGFTAYGQPCTGFSATGSNRNPNCLYRFDLKWQALCTPPNCASPQVSVTASLTYSGAGNPTFNLGKISVPAIIRSAQ